jgi:hypothetical protein
MDINAMTLVYFKESKRRRKERGMTTSLRISATRTGKRKSGKTIHKASHPEVSINKKGDSISTLIEASDNAWHEISDNNQVAHAHPKALNCNCSIEHNRRIGICDL